MANSDEFETSFKEDVGKLAGSKHCLFCSKLWKEIVHFYAHLPYELAHDAKTRQEYANEEALCHFHLWQLASMSSATGLSLALAEMAEGTSRRLSVLVERDRQTENVLKVPFDSDNSCLVCSYTDRVERQNLDYFGKLLAEPEGLEAYEKSNGFCLRHTVLIIAGMDEERSKFVIAHSVKRFFELAQNLRFFSQKTNMRQRALIQPDEASAFSRALIQLGGIKYLHYKN